MKSIRTEASVELVAIWTTGLTFHSSFIHPSARSKSSVSPLRIGEHALVPKPPLFLRFSSIVWVGIVSDRIATGYGFPHPPETSAETHCFPLTFCLVLIRNAEHSCGGVSNLGATQCMGKEGISDGLIKSFRARSVSRASTAILAVSNADLPFLRCTNLPDTPRNNSKLQRSLHFSRQFPACRLCIELKHGWRLCCARWSSASHNPAPL